MSARRFATLRIALGGCLFALLACLPSSVVFGEGAAAYPTASSNSGELQTAADGSSTPRRTPPVDSSVRLVSNEQYVAAGQQTSYLSDSYQASSLDAAEKSGEKPEVVETKRGSVLSMDRILRRFRRGQNPVAEASQEPVVESPQPEVAEAELSQPGTVSSVASKPDPQVTLQQPVPAKPSPRIAALPSPSEGLSQPGSIAGSGMPATPVAEPVQEAVVAHPQIAAESKGNGVLSRLGSVASMLTRDEEEVVLESDQPEPMVVASDDLQQSVERATPALPPVVVESAPQLNQQSLRLLNQPIASESRSLDVMLLPQPSETLEEPEVEAVEVAPMPRVAESPAVVESPTIAEEPLVAEQRMEVAQAAPRISAGPKPAPEVSSPLLSLQELQEESGFANQGSLGLVQASTEVDEGPMPAMTPWPERTKIVYRPAVVGVNSQGSPVLRPSVRVANRQAPYEGQVRFMSEVSDMPEVASSVEVPETWSAPIVEDPYAAYATQDCGSCTSCGSGCGSCNSGCGSCGPGCNGCSSCRGCNNCGPVRLGPGQIMVGHVRACLNGPCDPNPGLGPERVMHAISFVDTTQPMNNFRVRLDSAYDYDGPDRSEYFWAKTVDGRGPPAAETTLDYNDLRFYHEVGGKKFSVGTEVPIRFVDPVVNEDSAGIGDITITTKTLFMDGKRWQIANLFRTYIPSGDADVGLGTGHASIEPGFAWRYKWSDITYLHGDIKFWVPLGADAQHKGEVLSYGFAFSHVWHDSDCFAIMPTFEVVGLSFLDGDVTAPGGGVFPVDNDVVINLHPGIRFVWDNGSDCGTKEFGIFGGFNTSNNAIYEGILRGEFRWSW